MHLTSIHLLERQKRRRNRLQAYGLMQCKGTRPRGFREPVVPAWKPMPRPAPGLDFLARMTKMFDWQRPRRPPKKGDRV